MQLLKMWSTPPKATPLKASGVIPRTLEWGAELHEARKPDLSSIAVRVFPCAHAKQAPCKARCDDLALLRWVESSRITSESGDELKSPTTMIPSPVT